MAVNPALAFSCVLFFGLFVVPTLTGDALDPAGSSSSKPEVKNT
jgi:hypothetical protein